MSVKCVCRTSLVTPGLLNITGHPSGADLIHWEEDSIIPTIPIVPALEQNEDLDSPYSY